MVKLVNRAKMTTATTGTGTITVGSAVDGFQTFAAAGVSNGETIRYTIEDGTNWEVGSGTYNAGTLTRSVDESSNAGSAISLSGSAIVFVTASDADIQQPPSEGAFVDGDKTKLDGIEAGATADQTAGEIKTAYESNANTNAYTDAEKSKLAGIASGAEVNTVDSVNTQTGSVVLDADDISDAVTTNKFTTAAEISKLAGIEAGADVTDTTNVTAAGALMDSEVTNLAQVKAFNSADYATAAQGSLADSALQSGDNVSALTNDAGYTTNVGDITGVTAGGGISGGGTSGTVTVSHADTSAQGSVNNSGATFIQDVTVDTYGHVTGLGSATISPATIGAATSAQGALADSALQSGDNISALTNDAGYTTNVGDITGVTAGTGLSGGGTSGTVTINADVGTTASKLVQLDGSARLPAVDGSQLTNLPASAPSTAQVLSATAGASAGGVGTYVWAYSSSSLSFGSTYAGSSLRPTGVQVLPGFTSTASYVGVPPTSPLSGTWRAMGTETYRRNSSYQYSTILLRIS